MSHSVARIRSGTEILPIQPSFNYAIIILDSIYSDKLLK